MVLTDVGSSSSDYGTSIELQGDGKIVVSGWGNSSGINDFYVLRYNSDGSLDTTFNGIGKVTTAISSEGTKSDFALDLAIQSDGKIVLTGYSSDDGNNFTAVRYNSDGSLDSGFGSGGIVDFNFGGSSMDRAYSVSVKDDGSLVIGGASNVSGTLEAALLVLNSDGSLSSDFALSNTLGGTVNYTEGSTPVVLGADVQIIDPELTLLDNFAGASLTLARNGGVSAEDTFFATGTLAALTEGGSLVVGGTTIGTVTANSAGTLLLHFNSNATNALVNAAMQQIAYSNSSDTPPASVQIDWAFNDNNSGAQGTGGALEATGFCTINITAINDAPIVSPINLGSIDEDGSLLITQANLLAGATDVEGDSLTAINLALSSGDGSLIDHGDGTWTFTPTANWNGAVSFDFAVIDGIDTIGNTASLSVTAINDAPTFNTGTGIVTTPIGTGADRSYATVVQPDGKVLVAGTTLNGGSYDFVVARYNADGTLDTGFGTDGKVLTPVGTLTDEAHSIALQDDGKIVVAGYASSGNNDFAVVRYNADGSLDTGFGTGGKVTTPIGTDSDYAQDVAVQADGKIVVSGYTKVSLFDTDFALVRYNADGSLDSGFGTGGKVTTAFGTGYDEAYSVTVQADGKIIVAGSANNGSEDFALIRYNADGSLDSGFGTGGKVTTPIGTGAVTAYDVLVQADGKIVVAGQASGTGYDFALARYNADGSLDSGFGSGGTVLSAVSTNNDYGRFVALQSDGKIVVGGSSNHDDFDYDFALTRYNTDGSLDTSFGSGGTAFTQIGSANEYAMAGAVTAGDEIVLTGYSNNGTNDDLAVVRYDADGSLDTSFGIADALGGTVSYTEGAAAIVLDDSVDVHDAELDALNGGLGNYAGVCLTLIRNGGASAEDIFAFSDGNGITLSGNNLTKNSQIIAIFDTTATPGELVVSFTDANGEIPTSADVDNILQQITYANSSDTPPTSVQIDWTFDDGNTGAQGTGGALTATGSTTVNITAVNDDPTNAGSLPTDLVFLQDTQGKLNLSAIDLSDVDAGSGDLTLTITSANGHLQTMGWPGLTLGGTQSVLVLTGNLTDLNDFLNDTDSIDYEHGTPGISGNNVDLITIEITDNGNTGTGGGGTITLGTINIDVDPVAPQVDLDANDSTGTGINFTTTWTQGNGQISIADTDAAISDVDSVNLQSLTVTLTNHLDGADERMVADVSGTSISVTYAVGPGEYYVYLSGVDTVENYEKVLRTVVYDNTASSPNATTRIVTVQASDGTNASSLATTTINMTVTNVAPAITSGGAGTTASVDVAENTTAITTVTATDADLDEITYSISGGADAALFSIDASTGMLSFKGTPDFETPTDADADNVYEVTVQASDGSGGADSQAISVTVTNVDPTAVNDNYAVDADLTLSVDWWNTNWSNRQQLTFDNLAQSETLTDFPVLIVLNAGNIDYAQTNDGGSDLRFLAADGTELAYEIEQWNEGGDSSVWVRVPQITANSNADGIWMYYGNAVATSGENPAGVWDSNFVGVWHLNEEQAGTGGTDVYKDSTAYGNDGIDRVAVTGQEGQVTDGQEFDASDWIEIDHDASLDLKDSMTISFWIKPTSDSGQFNRVVEKGLWGYTDSYYFGGGDGTNDLTFYLNGQEIIDTADNILTVGVWQHAAVSYTSNGDGTSTARMYLDGVEIANDTRTTVVVTGNTGRLAIGHDDPLYDFNGFIDEVQISNTNRSADWIAAQYQATRNQFGSEFVQFQGEETAPALGGVLRNDLPDGTAGITVTNLDSTGTLGLVTLNPDGTFDYDPNGQFDYLAVGATASDTFSYDITEANGATTTATVTITITGVNDAPTVVGETFTAVEGVPFSSELGLNDLLRNDGDPEGDPLTVNTTPVSGPANGELILNADGTFTYTPNANFNGTDSFVYEVLDGNGGSAQATATFTVQPREIRILFTTQSDVNSSKVPGVESWDAGEVLAIGEPNLTFEPAGSDGSILPYMDLEVFSASGNMTINGMHWVSNTITVGGANSIDLQRGDLLFVSQSDDVMTSTNTLAISAGDVIVFRPDVEGDYSSGTFIHLLDQPGTALTTGITLIESDVVVGDVTLQAGNFLFTQESYVEESSIYHFSATDVGAGTTTGVVSTLISSVDIGINYNNFLGVMVISEDLYLDGTMVPAGSIVTTLANGDSFVGDNGILVDEDEIFYLTVTTTTMGSGTTSADATVLFDAGDVGLNNSQKKIRSFSIIEDIKPINNVDPVITLATGMVTYTEGDPPAVIDPAATLVDPDSADFDGGLLRVDLGTTGTANDKLAIRDEGTGAGQIGISGNKVTYQGIIIGNWAGGANGSEPLTILFNTNADVASIQALLRNITFENTSNNPSETQRAINFSISDGDGGSSDVVTRNIVVNAINYAPELSGANDLIAIEEDLVNSGGTLVSILISGRVTDADPGAVSGIAVVGVDNTNGGWEFSIDGGTTWTAFGSPSTSAARLLAATPDTFVRFVPDADWNGTVTDGITFHAWDQTSGVSGDAVDLTVSANLRDQFDAVSYGNDDGTAVWSSGWIEGNDGGQPNNGNIRIEGGALHLDNQDGGSLEFITRSADLSNAATAVLTFDYAGYGAGGLDTVVAEISADGGGTWTLLERMDVVGNESGSRSYNLESYTDLSADLQLRFRIAQGFEGSGQYISFDNVDIAYSGTGIGGSSSVSTATDSSSITVTPVNDAAVFSGDTAGSGNEDTTITGTLSVTDTADGMTTPNYTVSTDGTNGTATINATTGEWSYTPNANWSGADSFTVSVTDDDGNVESQIISITVNPVVDLTATDDSFSVDEDTTLSDTVAANDSTTSGGALSYALETGVSNGSLTLNADGSFSYTPTVNYNGSDSFSYTVTDAASGESATQTVSITVTPVNDSPVAGDDSITVVEDTPFTSTIDLDANDTDVDGDALSLVAGTFATTQGGTIVIAADGTYTYTPPANFNGTDSVDYTVTDGSLTDVGTLTITVTAVNDAPVLLTGSVNNLTLSEDASLTSLGLESVTYGTGGGSDESSQSLTYEVTVIPSPTSGDIFLVDGTTRVTTGIYTLAQIQGMQFKPADNWNGTTGFQFNVSDTGGTANGGSDSISQFISITVEPVNDAPIVDLNGSDGAGSGFTTTFTEGGGAVLVVDSDAIVTDIDSTAYNALSINFLTAPDGANEKLIVGGYTFSHGASDVATRTVGSTVFEIDFDGTGFSIARDGGGVIPDADLESLIRGISYENTSENPTSGSRTIEFVAVDDQGLISLASNSSVSVTPTNDNPVVNNLDGDVLNYSEGDGTVILDQGNDSVVSDVDSANFEGGSLNIECDSGLQATEDVFAIRNQGTGAGQIGVSVNDVTYGGIVIGTFSGGTGLAPLNIVFNSNATSATVSALLQNITYENTDNDNPTEGTRSITIDLTDGDGGAIVTQNMTVNVSAVNDVPTTSGLANQILAEDFADYTIDLKAIFADVETSDANLIYTVSGNSNIGVSIDVNGVATISSTANWNGTEAITFTAEDESGATVDAVADFIVSPVNDPSVTVADSATTAEDTPVAIAVLANDTDIDGAIATLVSATDGTHGTTAVNIGTGIVTYTPDADFTGSDSFTYTNSEGNSATVTVTVTPVNDAPVITSAAAQTAAENQTAVTTVTATDADLDVPTFSISGGADSALFSITAGGVLSFNAAQDFETFADANSDGVYEVEVTADDGNLGTDVQTILVTLTDVNEAPTLVSLSNSSIDENTDTSAGTTIGSLTTSDVDAGDTTSYSITGGADAGLFSLSGSDLILTDGVLDFESQASYEVTVRVTDSGGLTHDQTFTITVNDLNEAPTFDSAAVTGATEDLLYSYSIITSDVDGGASLTISATTLPTWLTLTDHGDGTATLSGTPGNAEVGDHAVVIEVSDGSLTATQSFTIAVSNTNDAPVITSAAAQTAAENQTAVTTVTATDADLDVPTFSISGGADSALFSITAGGVLSFNAAQDFETFADANSDGVYEVEVTADDGNLGTDVQTILVTLTDVNEAPTLVSLSNSSIDENTDTSAGTTIGSLTTSDVDAGDTTSYSITGGADAGLFSLSGSDLILTDGVLDFESQASYEVTVRVTDSGGLTHDQTFTITVNDLNEAPTFDSAAVTGATEDLLYSYSIITSDVDGGASLTISATTLPTWLTLTDHGDGTATLSGTPGNAEVGDHAVVIEVSDGSLTATQSFTIAVSNTNDAPVITSAAAQTAAENQTAVTTVTATDADLDVPTFSISGGADSALFSITAGGVLSFNAAQDFETFADANSDGVYEVEVTADDGNLGTDVQTILVTLTDVNEAPTLVSLSNSSIDENTDTSAGTTIGSLTTSDVDAGDTTSYSITGGADAGLFSLSGSDLILTDGVLDFESQASYEVTVRVTDSGGLTHDQTFTITVNDLNEAPTFDSAAVTGATEDLLYSYSIITSDVDGGASLTISATTLPTWLTLTDHGDGTATLSGTPGNAEVGDHAVVIEVSDGSLTATQSFTIAVSNTNDAPVITSAAAQTAAENQTAVTTVTATDADLDVPTFSISGGADSALFSITAGGVLSFNAAQDFETFADANSDGVYEVEVTADDGNLGTDVQTILVTLTDVNEAPTLVSLSNSSIDENTDTSAGTTIGSLTTSDVDAGDTTSYSITGGADAGLFSLSGSDLILTDGVLDFESQASYEVTVRVTDSGGLTHDQTFTITVNDLNEAPTFDSAAVTGATEDLLYSYSIITSDVDGGASLTISATTLPTWLTLTDHGDGTATLSGTPGNAEVGDHAVVIEVSDGSLTATQSFTIAVSNTNDAPVITSAAAQTAAENQTAVTTVTATDADLDVPTFSISGGADSALFSITAGGVLSFNAAQDFETFADANSDGVYEVEVTADDGNLGTDVQTILVTLTDVNEAPTLVSLSNSSIDENTDTSAGTTIGSLTTSDVDAGDTTSYSITGGADAGLFSLSGSDLILTDGVLDFESQASYEVTVRVTDSGGLTHDQTFTITVNDLNEAPTFDSAAVTGATEDLLYSYSIITSDVDGGASLTISATTLPTWLTLTDHGDGTATLSGTPGNAEVGDHAVVIEVSDGSLTATQSFTIAVSNTNDAPVITSAAAQTAAENQTAVTTVTATDADLDVPTFSISGGADSALFSITAGGVLSFNAAQDFETFADANSDGVYEVEVTADDGNLGTDVQTILVTLTDVNEAPTLVSLSNSSIDENTDTSAGTTIGSLTTSDVDAGDTTSYSITGGADAGLFSLSGSDLILTDGVLDFESQASYEVTVRVTDSGGLTHDQTFTITVNDLNEAPTFDSAAVTGATEDLLYSYSIITSDVDGGASLTISATTLPTWLTLTDHGDGTATLSGTPGNAEVGDHAVVIEVSDGSLTATQSFTISVGNTNDAPTVTPVNLGSLNEDGSLLITQANLLTGSSDPTATR